MSLLASSVARPATILAACFVFTAPPRSEAAQILAAPGEAGLRAAIAAAQDGDTVIVTSNIDLQAPVRIEKRITVRSDRQLNSGSIHGAFPGELFQTAAEGIVFEWLFLSGSPQTDAVRTERNVVLRDCVIHSCREPVASEYFSPSPITVRLERVSVLFNRYGIGCRQLEAKDCTFASNQNTGASAAHAVVEGCIFEHNNWDGLSLLYGSVTNCVFRFNAAFGLRFDPDPGAMTLRSSLFYGNAGGGLLLREEAVATIDNCTFTRHTGLPAVIISEAHDILFRHCTVADNVVIGGDEGAFWPSYPVGGAFAIMSAGRVGRVELQNCLIADNPTTGSPHASGLVGDWIDGGGNVIGGPAHLAVLRDNGGPTLSLLPLPGSPAIEAGVPSDIVRDARGLSRQAGAAPDAGAIEVGAQQLTDADSDGLADIWEVFRGLNPADPADAAADVDGDGQVALAEFHSGTDPLDPQSVFKIAQFEFNQIYVDRRDVVLTWSTVPGVTYRLETSSDLQQWSKAFGFLYSSVAPSGTRFLEFSGVADTAAAFYRLVVDENPFD